MEEKIEDLFKKDEMEVADDIKNIVNMIDNEKMRQAKEDYTPSEKKELSKKTETIIRPIHFEKVEEVPNELERLHLRIVGDSIDVLYRPNHCYVAFVKNDEKGLEEIKKIATMTRDEFKEYLDKSICFRYSTNSELESIKRSSLETWFLNAWSLTTKKILADIGVNNPIEIPFVK